jgi:hypothetical protein
MAARTSSGPESKSLFQTSNRCLLPLRQFDERIGLTTFGVTTHFARVGPTHLGRWDRSAQRSSGERL